MPVTIHRKFVDKVIDLPLAAWQRDGANGIPMGADDY